MYIANPIFAVIATASLTTAHPSSTTAKNHTQEIIDTLAGTYSLLNTSSTHNNLPIPDAAYGAHPVGILTYSRSGYMSATITATEPQFRPNLTFPFQPTDKDSDWALVGKHSIGYAGPFRINDALPANKTNGQLFHGPLTVANVPTWAGTLERRNYTLVKEGGETFLRIGSERGGGFRGVLWWKRID